MPIDLPRSPASDSSPQQLAQISTIWSNVLKAHGGPDQADTLELTRFFDRYHRAILRYLVACVHDEDVATDLFQEFALRFVRGDFAQVKPRAGSFRQYVKTALINLVRDHQTQHARHQWTTEPTRLTTIDADLSSIAFDAGVRDELLSRTWRALDHAQASGGPPFHSALKARVEQPEATSSQLAQYIADQLRQTEVPSDAALRKLIQRAREAFADHLLNQTQLVLGDSTWEQVEEELATLGLLPYCVHALDARRGCTP